MLVYSMIQAASKANINAFMDYIERLDAEWQSTFCISIAKTPEKQSLAFSAKKFAVWVSKNEDIL